MNSSRRSAKLSPAQIKKLLIILALVLVVLTALVLVLRNRVKQQFGREEEREVLSASVTTGSISSSVYGSGLLADEDVEQLDIPSGVDVETICVSRGKRWRFSPALPPGTACTTAMLPAWNTLSSAETLKNLPARQVFRHYSHIVQEVQRRMGYIKI